MKYCFGLNASQHVFALEQITFIYVSSTYAIQIK